MIEILEKGYVENKTKPSKKFSREQGEERSQERNWENKRQSTKEDSKKNHDVPELKKKKSLTPNGPQYDENWTLHTNNEQSPKHVRDKVV